MAKKIENARELEKLSFEQSIEKLNQIVKGIESGQTPLGESLSEYEKGMDLIKHCRKILNDAEKKIESISEAESEGQDSEPGRNS